MSSLRPGGSVRNPLHCAASELTRLLGGVLSKTLNGIPVLCTPEETAQFMPPPGQTCASYGGAFATSAGGYYLDPSSTTLCQYCTYSFGNGYLDTLGISGNEAWRDLGIFCVYVISNWALVYFFIWTVRIKGWSFGFGYVFGLAGKAIGAVKGLFKSKSKKEGGTK